MKKINENRARKLFKSGEDIFILPKNLDPDEMYYAGIWIEVPNKSEIDKSIPDYFDYYTNNYVIDHNTKSELAFYID